MFASIKDTAKMLPKTKKSLKIIADFQGFDLNLCTEQDLNLHPIKLGYAPQTYASTSSATGALSFCF